MFNADLKSKMATTAEHILIKCHIMHMYGHYGKINISFFLETTNNGEMLKYLLMDHKLD
jgi:hypothetical protein